jgi:hypothetical protein
MLVELVGEKYCAVPPKMQHSPHSLVQMPVLPTMIEKESRPQQDREWRRKASEAALVGFSGFMVPTLIRLSFAVIAINRAG